MRKSTSFLASSSLSNLTNVMWASMPRIVKPLSIWTSPISMPIQRLRALTSSLEMLKEDCDSQSITTVGGTFRRAQAHCTFVMRKEKRNNNECVWKCAIPEQNISCQEHWRYTKQSCMSIDWRSHTNDNIRTIEWSRVETSGGSWSTWGSTECYNRETHLERSTRWLKSVIPNQQSMAFVLSDKATCTSSRQATAAPVTIRKKWACMGQAR